MRDQLIEGDLGPLLPARRLVLLKVRLITVQRGEDVAHAGSHGYHRNDGGDRNVVKDSRTIAGKQPGGPHKPLHGNDLQETPEVRKFLTVRRRDVDAED